MTYLLHYFARLLIFAFILFGHAFLGQAQQNGTSLQFERLNAYQLSKPTEKIYIHTNREVLSLGDTVWMSIYTVAGPYHEISKISGLVYVDLIDPSKQIIASLNILLDTMGVGAGQFALADSMVAGNYYIRAYTNYSRNFPEEYFFTKSLDVQPRLSKQETIKEKPIDSIIHLQFFPEGGNLIAGLPNKMAFKCINERQLPINISGVIIDEDGNEITTFKTTHDGMGLALFTPDHKKSYHAKYSYQGEQFTVSLPDVQPTGYLMSIRQSRENIYLTVAASEGTDLSNTLLLAHSKGLFFYEAQTTGNGNLLQVVFGKDTIPSGILHFTFFGSNGLPVSERLAFNEKFPEEIPLELSIPTTAAKRQAVEISVKLPEIIQASLSMSVIPATIFTEIQANIHEYLMLTSDLAGYVHQPMYYFDNENPNQIRDIDLLMMTHGWRRFDWSNVLEVINLIEFFPESGFSVKGKVTGYVTRNKAKKLPLELSFMENVLVTSKLETTETGEFLFAELPVEDTMTVVIRAINDKKGGFEKNALITINEPEKLTKLNHLPPVMIFDAEKSNAAKEKGKELFDIKAAFDKDVVILNEVSVIRERDRFNDPYHRRYQLYDEPSRRLIVDSIVGGVAFLNIFDLIRGRMNGVQIIGNYPNQSIAVRGQGSLRDDGVQFYFNGMQVNNQFVNSLNVRDISHIDVLMGGEALVYPLAANGVVLIYTKDGFATKLNRAQEGIAFQKIIGFHTPRQFYAPDYDNPTEEDKIRPDYRSTLYWNPIIRPENGQANIRFFTSDETGSFVYVLEGITNTGSIIRKTGKFQVN